MDIIYEKDSNRYKYVSEVRTEDLPNQENSLTVQFLYRGKYVSSSYIIFKQRIEKIIDRKTYDVNIDYFKKGY